MFPTFMINKLLLIHFETDSHLSFCDKLIFQFVCLFVFISIRMEKNIEVRKVTQDVLLFVWFKHGALSEEPPRESGLIPDISDELMNNLSVSVWIESFRTQFIWDDFFKMHFERMTSSSELFANYVAYASYVLNKPINAYERFFDIFSIVSEFSLRCLEGDCKEYLNTCVDLFCTFFEKELYWNFKDQGGWKSFNEYIGKQYNSIKSKFMISENISSVNPFKYLLEAHDFLKKKKPHYVVNGIILKNITRNHVETHEKSVNFAKSIRYKLETLLQKTFGELIMDFTETYIQVKNLCKWGNEEHFNKIKNKDEQWNLVKYRRRKKQLEQCSSRKLEVSPSETKSKEEKQQNIQKSSDRIKRRVEQSFLQKIQLPPAEIKNEEKRQNIQKSSGGMKRQAELDRGEGWNLVEHHRNKKQSEQCSSQEVQISLGRTKSKEKKQQNIRKSSDIIKSQEEQSSLPKNQLSPSEMKNKAANRQNIQKLPDTMKKLEQNKDEEWNLVKYRRKKNQLKLCSSQDSQISPAEIMSKNGAREIIQKSSVRMKSQVEQGPSKKVQVSPDEMKSKKRTRQTLQKSPEEIKSQVEYGDLQKVQVSPAEMKCKEETRNMHEISDGMKRKVEQSPSRKVQESSEMKSKSEQRQLFQKSLDEMKRKKEHMSTDQESSSRIESRGEEYSSLNLKSPKIISKNKELEQKTVTIRDPLKIPNSDTINLQDRVARVRASHLNLKSTKMEITKKLLDDMSVAITNISELVRLLCEKYGVEIPAELQVKRDVMNF